MTRIKPTSTQDENKRLLEAECLEIYAANLISGQWTVAICCYLSAGRLRFGELKKRLVIVTDRMLTLELKRMEEKGLVVKYIFPEVPVRVEYELTPIGQELLPIIYQLRDWGQKHKEQFESKI
jgi:DNA-binding HxlR family transcriptional regulator